MFAGLRLKIYEIDLLSMKDIMFFQIN